MDTNFDLEPDSVMIDLTDDPSDLPSEPQSRSSVEPQIKKEPEEKKICIEIDDDTVDDAHVDISSAESLDQLPHHDHPEKLEENGDIPYWDERLDEIEGMSSLQEHLPGIKEAAFSIDQDLPPLGGMDQSQIEALQLFNNHRPNLHEGTRGENVQEPGYKSAEVFTQPASAEGVDWAAEIEGSRSAAEEDTSVQLLHLLFVWRNTNTRNPRVSLTRPMTSNLLAPR